MQPRARSSRRISLARPALESASRSRTVVTNGGTVGAERDGLSGAALGGATREENGTSASAERGNAATAERGSVASTKLASSVGPERHACADESLGVVELSRSPARASDGSPRASIGDARTDVPTPRSVRGPLDGESILCGSPREVLARIVPGDPLAIRDVVADVLRAQCLFLDADRVHLRALARTARAALRFRGSGLELRAWLIAQASDAVAEILAEDLDTPRVDANSAFAQFARPLGLDPEAMRRGCVAFNRLPIEDRAAFFALVVEDVGLEAHARASGVTTNEIGRRARRGLEAVVRANHPDLPPPARTAPRRTTAARTTESPSPACDARDVGARTPADSLSTARPVSLPPTADSAPGRIVHREEPR